MKSSKWEKMRREDPERFDRYKKEYIMNKKTRQESIRQAKREEDIGSHQRGTQPPGSYSLV